jgi:hypothetical protein
MNGCATELLWVGGFGNYGGAGGCEAWDFVVILHVGTQRKLFRHFRIASGELVGVAILIPVERVGGIEVEDHQVGVVHSEFAESDAIPLEVHVIGVFFLVEGRSLFAGAKNGGDGVVCDAHCGNFSANVWWGKQSAEIHEQVVLVGIHAINFAGVDYVGQLDAKSAHDTLQRDVEGFDFFGFDAQAAVGINGESAGGFERDVTLAVQLAFDDELTVFDGNIQIFEWGIFGGEDVRIHDLGESGRGERDSAGGDADFEGSFVVEDGHIKFAGGPEFAGESFDMSGGLGGEMEHNVAHFGFDALSSGFRSGGRRGSFWCARRSGSSGSRGGGILLRCLFAGRSGSFGTGCESEGEQ